MIRTRQRVLQRQVLLDRKYRVGSSREQNTQGDEIVRRIKRSILAHQADDLGVGDFKQRDRTMGFWRTASVGNVQVGEHTSARATENRISLCISQRQAIGLVLV